MPPVRAERGLSRAKIARSMTRENPLSPNIEKIRQQVSRAAMRAGRNASEIEIIAVSKTFSAEAVRDAYDAGLRAFGENRVQEWDEKRATLADLAATWHMIGHVQTNKARKVVQLFNRVDSVDREEIARKLDTGAAETGKRLEVLIEVHLGGEASKSGVEESELSRLAEIVASLTNLKLLGLMTVPPYFDETEKVRPYFRRLRELRDATGARLRVELPVLSMGMSHDFEIAIEEGATEVRIGTAIFGGRHK